MLKKILGVTLITKLRAILLMEADFNAANKILCGMRTMNQAQKHHLISDEISSEKNWMADDDTLTKTLFYDIVRQSRILAAIASVNASNCYNRIAHVIASLVFQMFGIPESAIRSMLRMIKNMKFFLQRGFGDSTRIAGGGVHVKAQGLTQGNGASPAGWAVISIVILSTHGKKGLGTRFRCLITNLSSHISAILYVDNTDLLHINFGNDKSTDDVHVAIQNQNSVNSWGNHLIVTGGALKPKNTFTHVYLLNGFAVSGDIQIIASLATTEPQCHFQEGAPQQSPIVLSPTQR
jgi:hypothetical protein